jgi:thiosulfate/3-mercaptopyruvate sulfurtransferase
VTDPAVVPVPRTAPVPPLVDPGTLADQLASADPPTVLDVRWRLPGSAPDAPPTREDYLSAHIPGAVFVDLDADLCGPPGDGGRHPLPEPAALQEALRAAGVRDGGPVVVYDGGDNQAAARAWWTLRWAGHADTRVLDGGWKAWTGAGLPTEPGEVSAAPGDVTVRPGALPVLDAADAGALPGRGVLLDARIPGRFRGEVEPVDKVAGRIPGATNVPAASLSRPDGALLPVADLRKVFAAAGVGDGTPVGAYCGSGVTAAHTVLALTVAGVPDPALYVGSWSHWITDPQRPIGTGPEEREARG